MLRFHSTFPILELDGNLELAPHVVTNNQFGLFVPEAIMNAHTPPINAESAYPISSDHRHGIQTVIFRIDSLEEDMRLIDFYEYISEAMEDLTAQEKQSARIKLSCSRKLIGEWLDDVAVAQVSYTRLECDREMEIRLADASKQSASAQKMIEGRDRIEFARLRKLFESKEAA